MHACVRDYFLCACVWSNSVFALPLRSCVCMSSSTTRSNPLVPKTRTTRSLSLSFFLTFLNEWAHFSSVNRLRECSLSLMIYRLSGLDEPPLDVSPALTRLTIHQCRPRYTELYVELAGLSQTVATAFPCHSGRTFSSLHIRRIPPRHRGRGVKLQAL